MDQISTNTQQRSHLLADARRAAVSSVAASAPRSACVRSTRRWHGTAITGLNHDFGFTTGLVAFPNTWNAPMGNSAMTHTQGYVSIKRPTRHLGSRST